MLLSQAPMAAGLADLRLGAYASALASFQRARLLNPLHPLARCGARAATIGSGLAAMASNSPDLARDVETLPQSGPCGAQRELFQGDLALESHLLNRNPNDWERAASAFKRALVIDPELAEAEQRLGTLADLQDDLPSARRRFESAQRLAAGQPLLASRYRNGLAKVLLQGSAAEWKQALLLFDGHTGPVLLSTCVLGNVVDASTLPRPLPKTVACRWPGLIRGVIDDPPGLRLVLDPRVLMGLVEADAGAAAATGGDAP
jgi:tetratricopeptide (TPR) repeat protein